jgi:hypothetical protein
MTSRDSGITTQRSVVFNPRTMTFREYDKKTLAFRPDLEYWEHDYKNPRYGKLRKQMERMSTQQMRLK